MSLIKINYSLNRKYFVETSALEQMVKTVSKKSKDLKIIEQKIVMDDSKNDFIIKIKASIKKGASYEGTILTFQKELEKNSIALIDSKPENISITIIEEH
ncbi:MAG: hypothetical protein KAG91_00905 [Mycoplasmataceae bacterium]|nr:hypothetical protein [Mycoplasmataceae bacterium]